MHLHRPTQENILPAIWASLTPVRLTYKINHLMEIKITNVHTQAMFLVPQCPLPVCPFIQSPSLAGMLHRSGQDARSERRGTWCLLPTVTDWGTWGYTWDDVWRNPDQEGGTYPRRALAVSHARDKSRKARPGAELEAGDPGRTRGRHRAERGAWMVGCVNCRASGRAQGWAFQAPVWVRRALCSVLWYDRFPPALVHLITSLYKALQPCTCSGDRPPSLAEASSWAPPWEPRPHQAVSILTFFSFYILSLAHIELVYFKGKTFWVYGEGSQKS